MILIIIIYIFRPLIYDLMHTLIELSYLLLIYHNPIFISQFITIMYFVNFIDFQIII